MFTTYSPQNIVDGLGPIVQIDYLPENYIEGYPTWCRVAPRNAQIRDSQKAFLATKKPKRVGQQVGLSFVVLTTVNKEHRLC